MGKSKLKGLSQFRDDEVPHVSSGKSSELPGRCCLTGGAPPRWIPSGDGHRGFCRERGLNFSLFAHCAQGS